jgi:hypothetical protein
MGQEATRLDDDRTPLNATAGDGTNTDDPDAIEQEIEQTRAEMSGTIDAIQEKLDPERLKAQAKEAAHDATIGRVIDAKDQAVEKVQDLASQATDKVRNLTGGNGDDHQPAGTSSTFTMTARDTGNTFVETIKANPVPAAIAGAGLGWFMTSRSGDDHGQKRSSSMRNTPSTRGYRGQQMDYRTGYTDWDRQQPEPGHLRQYEGDTFMSQVTSTGNDVVGMIQRNPIPAALAGVGLGWFLMRRTRNGDDHGDQPYYYRPSQHTTFSGGYGYRGSQNWQQGYDTQGYGSQSHWQQGSSDDEGRMSQMAGTAQETAGDVMHRAQDVGSQAMDQVSHYGSMAREQMGDLPHQAQHQMQHLKGTYQQKMNDNPLLMGIVAMGLGVAVGMMIPETQKENQVFGEKRDELMERAQDMAGNAVVNAQEAAQGAIHDAQGLVAEKVTEAVKESVTGGSQNSEQANAGSSASTS